MEKVKGNVTVESINEIMVSIQKDFFFQITGNYI